MGVAIFNSKSEKIEGVDRICVQLIWTGTPTGNAFIELSNDDEAWFPSGLAGFNPAGVDGSILVELDTAAAFVRYRYQSVSGTGVIQGHFVGKAHG